MKVLKRKDLHRLLETISREYQLLVPVEMSDATRLLRPYGEGAPSLRGLPVQRKPTEVFLPQREQLVTFESEGRVKVPTGPSRPLALFGLNAADLACIAFIDRFFAEPPADDAYFRQRKQALLIGLTGLCGPDGSFMPLAEKNCDLELIALADCWLAAALTERGQQLLLHLPEGTQQDLEMLQRQRAQNQGEFQSTLLKASALLQEDLVPDEFWAEIGDRCILCSGCNLVCPTCTCFCMEDRKDGEKTVRSRVWDSCQFDGFMREASGHNPMGSEALRTRRRIHHKLAADLTKWGGISCFSCGRCDQTCPTGIGIQAVAAEIVERFG